MTGLFVSTCMAIFIATQSVALSCPPLSIEDDYVFHSKAKERYILVTGKLTNKRNVVLGPKTPGVGAQSENFTATFVGRQATRAGFTNRLKATVAVSAECGGPWCGSVTVDKPMIAFLKITPYGHVLSVGPCGGGVTYSPTPDQSERVLQCLRGGVCTPKFR